MLNGEYIFGLGTKIAVKSGLEYRIILKNKRENR
jgi:hypothetical protein